jgi:hypothetical protein
MAELGVNSRSGKMKAERRYAGIDLGKRTYTMAVINTDGKTDDAGRQRLYGKLESGDGKRVPVSRRREEKR